MIMVILFTTKPNNEAFKDIFGSFQYKILNTAECQGTSKGNLNQELELKSLSNIYRF